MSVMKRFEEEIERFPEGSKNHNFFKQLLINLKPDFLTASIRKDLNESHADLSGSIQQYFQQHIIYASALKAPDYNQLESNEFAHESVELFHLNILKKYVQNDKYNKKFEFFKESQVLLANMLGSKQKSKSVQLLTKSVEDNISEFCMQFAEYALQKKINLRTWEKDFDSAIKQLSQRAAILDSVEVKLNTISSQLQDILLAYNKELTEGIKILDALLNLFQEKIEFQIKETQYAVDRSLHLKLKAECLELELLASTYSENAVKALQIIEKELGEKKKNSEKSIACLSNKLENYQILGPEYEQLVEKYQLLSERIEKQKWAIDFLKADIASKQQNQSE